MFAVVNRLSVWDVSPICASRARLRRFSRYSVDSRATSRETTGSLLRKAFTGVRTPSSRLLPKAPVADIVQCGLSLATIEHTKLRGSHANAACKLLILLVLQSWHAALDDVRN